MKPGLEKITDRSVYRSSVKRKDSRSLVGLRTGKMSRDGGDKELKVGYIPPQNNAACASPQPSGHTSEVPARQLEIKHDKA